MQLQTKKYLFSASRLLHVDAPPAISRNLFRRALMGALTFLFLFLFQVQATYAQAPSSVLPDIVNFKLEYPLDEDGNDYEGVAYDDREEPLIKYHTIDGEDLDGYTAPSPFNYYFFADGNEVVFRAHCAGALSSQGSYPRCELREQINGNNTFWNYNDEQELNATLRITHLPDEKQEVCILQLKGNTSTSTSGTEEVMRLEYAAHTTEKLHLTRNEEADPTLKNIMPYSLGDVLEARIYVNNGDVTIELKNVTQNETFSNTYESNYAYGYFKAGCYTQSSIWNQEKGKSEANEDPDAYGEVRFSRLILGSDDNGGGSCSAVVPSSRTVSNYGQTSVTLNWSYSSSFNHYNVRYRKTGTSEWTGLTSLRLNEGDFSVSNNIARKTITGLSSNTTYQWQVRAKCDDTSIATSYSAGAGPNFTTLSGGDSGGTWNPDPDKKYYIDVPQHDRRIAAASGGSKPYMTSTSTTGSDVEWKFVAKGNGYWHIRRAAGGSTPGLRVLNSDGASDMQATSSNGSYTYYEFTTGSISGTYFATLPGVSFSNDRLQVDPSDNISFVPSANHAGSWESLKFTEVSGSSSGGNNIVTMRKRNAMSYALDSGNNEDLYLYDYNANNANQQWEEIDEGNGHYRYKKVNTDVCIDGGSGGSRYQVVTVETCDDTQDQEWKKISMGDGYYRLEKRNAEDFSLDGKGSGSNGQIPHLWTNSNTNQNQHWFFTTVGTSNRAAFDEPRSLTSEGVDGIDAGHLSFWPNPSQGDLTVLVPAGELEQKTMITLTDMLGRTVFQRNGLLPGQRFNITKPLASGTYILRWTDEEGTLLQTDKVVRN